MGRHFRRRAGCTRNARRANSFSPPPGSFTMTLARPMSPYQTDDRLLLDPNAAPVPGQEVLICTFAGDYNFVQHEPDRPTGEIVGVVLSVVRRVRRVNEGRVRA